MKILIHHKLNIILTLAIVACVTTAALPEACAERVDYSALGKSVWDDYMRGNMPPGMKQSMQDIFKKDPAKAYETLGRIFRDQVDEVEKTFKQADHECLKNHRYSSELLRCLHMAASGYCEQMAWKTVISETPESHPAVQWSMSAEHKRTYETFQKREKECAHPKLKVKNFIIGGGKVPGLFQEMWPKMPKGHKLIFKVHRTNESDTQVKPHRIRAQIETVRAPLTGLNDCEKKQFQSLSKRCSQLSDEALASNMKLVDLVSNKLNPAFNEWNSYKKETDKRHMAESMYTDSEESPKIKHRRKIQQRLLENWNTLHKQYLKLQKDYASKRELADKCWNDAKRQAKDNCKTAKGKKEPKDITVDSGESKDVSGCWEDNGGRRITIRQERGGIIAIHPRYGRTFTGSIKGDNLKLRYVFKGVKDMAAIIWEGGHPPPAKVLKQVPLQLRHIDFDFKIVSKDKLAGIFQGLFVSYYKRSGEFDYAELTSDPMEWKRREAKLKSISATDKTFQNQLTEINVGDRFWIAARASSGCAGIKDRAWVTIYPEGKESEGIKVRLIETGPDTSEFRSDRAVSVASLKAESGQTIVVRSGLRGTSIRVKAGGSSVPTPSRQTADAEQGIPRKNNKVSGDKSDNHSNPYYVKYTGQKLRKYPRPFRSHAIVHLHLGDKLQLTGKRKGTWFKVKDVKTGKVGWIHQDSMTRNKKMARRRSLGTSGEGKVRPEEAQAGGRASPPPDPTDMGGPDM